MLENRRQIRGREFRVQDRKQRRVLFALGVEICAADHYEARRRKGFQCGHQLRPTLAEEAADVGFADIQVKLERARHRARVHLQFGQPRTVIAQAFDQPFKVIFAADERTGRRELQLLQRYEDAAFKLEFLRDFFAPLRCDVGKVRLQGPCYFDDQLARAVF